jgi:hypothetical protein
VPDLLQREFTAEQPSTRYVGDITYLPVSGGRFSTWPRSWICIRVGW